MSELWCDYEARINWLQMYSIPPAMFPTDETEQRLKTHKRRKSQDDPLSPRSKRAARCSINPERSDDSPVVEPIVPVQPQLRESLCDQCPAEVQFYRGAANRTYSSEPHFEPTGSELWPDEVTKPKNFDLNCVEDDDLDQEAMAFLNAQNDYFGVGGEHVADNIELGLNFRWDMNRARELCIAHKCPNDFNLMDLYFAVTRGRKLLAYLSQFERLDEAVNTALSVGRQNGHGNTYPQFYLFWRPDLAGAHVQLQTGSLQGAYVPFGAINWPRRWWREALRRSVALNELKQQTGIDLQQIDKLMNDVLIHVNDMLTRGAESTMDQVFDAKYKQKLYPVVKLITQYATEELQPTTISNSLSADQLRLVDFDCPTHRPNVLLGQTRHQPLTRGFQSSTRRLSCAYYSMHEYLCATCGAARLRFSPSEFLPLMSELQSALDHNRAIYA